MRRTTSRRHRVVAAAVAAITAVTGVLVAGYFERSGAPESRPAPAANTASASPPTTGFRGPDGNAAAATANLRHVANAMQIRTRSVTAVVTLPAGLNLTARVDISVQVDTGVRAQRVTQTYDNGSGNRLLANLTAGDGHKRRVDVVVSLAEAGADGTYFPYGVTGVVYLEPLYDVSTGPLTFTLLTDCDPGDDSEPFPRWRMPSNEIGGAGMSMRRGDSVTLTSFARTYPEVGESSKLGPPTFAFVERDPQVPGTGSAYQTVPRPVTPPLVGTLAGHTRVLVGDVIVSGTTHTNTLTIRAGNQPTCEGSFSYTITYQLRRYPNL